MFSPSISSPHLSPFSVCSLSLSHTHTHTHTYAHVHTCAYTHTHTHAHTLQLSSQSPSFANVPPATTGGGGHCIGDCTPNRDRGQSEVKRSRRNFEAGQAVKLGSRNRGQLKYGQSLSRQSMGVVDAR